MSIRFVFTSILIVVVAVFAMANMEKAVISFLIKDFELSLSIIIILSAILGALIVGFLSTIKNTKLKREIKRKNIEIDQVSVEISEITKKNTDQAQEINTLETKLEMKEKEVTAQKEKEVELLDEAAKANERAAALSKEVENLVEAARK